MAVQLLGGRREHGYAAGGTGLRAFGKTQSREHLHDYITEAVSHSIHSFEAEVLHGALVEHGMGMSSGHTPATLLQRPRATLAHPSSELVLWTPAVQNRALCCCALPPALQLTAQRKLLPTGTCPCLPIDFASMRYLFPQYSCSARSCMATHSARPSGDLTAMSGCATPTPGHAACTRLLSHQAYKQTQLPCVRQGGVVRTSTKILLTRASALPYTPRRHSVNIPMTGKCRLLAPPASTPHAAVRVPLHPASHHASNGCPCSARCPGSRRMPSSPWSRKSSARTAAGWSSRCGLYDSVRPSRCSTASQ